MKAFIISIGEEMLIGQTVNTNAAWMASRLNDAGIEVNEIRIITDDRDEIFGTLTEATRKSELVLMTGGLGPTRDDMTRDVLCRFFDSELVLNQTVLDDITVYLKNRGRELTDINRMQAMVPDRAYAIRNPYGTAPGMWFSAHENQVIAMPGVPYEMKEIMQSHIIPYLQDKDQDQYIIHKNILTHGLGESTLAELIADWEDDLPKHMQLAYLPSTDIIKLRLTAKGNDREALNRTIEQETEKLKKIIPDYIWGYDDDTLEGLTGALLQSKGKLLATAESCTGGAIASRITSVAGSSAYYTGSVIAYDNHVKIQQLGVDPDLLKTHGAVSCEVAEAMAQGVQQLLRTDYAIGVTGIAGPAGGTDEKPTGTTWIAIAAKDNVISRKFSFGDSRDRNIIRASNAALAMLKQQLA